MNETLNSQSQNLNVLLQVITQKGMSRAAEGFSGMVGESITATTPSIRMIPLSKMRDMVGDAEDEVVGVYIRVDNGLPGHMMLIMPYLKALNLVDLLLGEPEGTTQALGSLERSALGEVGNLTCTFFLNTTSALTGISVHPSPPAVSVDMIGAILDIVIAISGGLTEKGLLLQTTFMRGGREMQADFWIIPDREALQSIVSKGILAHA